MAAITNHVTVTITKASARLTRTGFGTPMVLAVHNEFSERARSYSNIAAVAEDFASTDEAYRMANVLFSQQLSPPTVKIGRREVSAAQSQIVTVSVVADDTDYTLIVNGQSFTIDSGTGASAIAIAAALKVAFDAGFTGNVSFTDPADGTYVMLATVAAEGFSIETDAGQSIGDAANTNAIADELTAVRAYDDDWYFLVTTKVGSQTNRDTDNAAASSAIEAMTKVFAYSDANSDALTGGTSNIFSTLSVASRERSLGKYAVEWYNYPECAIIGLQGPKDPGSANWKFQVVSSDAAQTLTDSQRTALDALYANYTESIGGNIITSSPMQTASGEWIDNVRLIDQTEVRIGEDVFALEVASQKIPQTNAGIQSVVNTVKGTLLYLAGNGGYDESTIVVTGSDIGDVSATDKSNRLLEDIEFSVTTTGAWNKVAITGVVQV